MDSTKRNQRSGTESAADIATDPVAQKAHMNSLDQWAKMEEQGRERMPMDGQQLHLASLPANANTKDFYYCWERRSKMASMLEAWYQPALTTDGNQICQSSGDDDNELVLFCIPWRYRERDLEERERQVRERQDAHSNIEDPEEVRYTGMKSALTKTATSVEHTENGIKLAD